MLGSQISLLHCPDILCLNLTLTLPTFLGVHLLRYGTVLTSYASSLRPIFPACHTQSCDQPLCIGAILVFLPLGRMRRTTLFPRQSGLCPAVNTHARFYSSTLRRLHFVPTVLTTRILILDRIGTAHAPLQQDIVAFPCPIRELALKLW